MRVTSRASATQGNGKAIDDFARAAFGMTFTQPAVGLTARCTTPPPGARLP